MKTLSLAVLSACMVAACVPIVVPLPPKERMIPTGPPPEVLQPGYRPAEFEQDLFATARERFGLESVRRALGADTYVFAKFYHGMLPPPRPGDPPYKPPMALLIRENGQWFAATPTGFRPAKAEAVPQLEALLANRAFWAAPNWTGPRCTDAGASLLMLKVPNRAEIIRHGTCGETQPTEHLVRLALEA
jgi:hypothetical protein